MEMCYWQETGESGRKRHGLKTRVKEYHNPYEGLKLVMDFGGIDISAKNLNNPNIDAVPIEYRPKKLFELVEKGHLGVKTGKGWYDYSGKSQAEWYRERDLEIIRLLKIIQ